jgi:hypothetical protein
MTRSKYKFGWLVVVLALGTLACTCGALSGLNQAGQDLATAQALATEFDVDTDGDGDVTVGNVPDNIPVIDGAENVTSFAGATAYFVNSDLETVKQFYLDGMPAKGWQEAQAPVEVEGSVVTLTYENDSDQAVVSITAQGSQVAVAIAVSPK